MDRSEIMEIRKIFSKYKEGESAAGYLSGCFINTKQEIKGTFSKRLLSLSKNEIHKYYDIFKKVLANSDADVYLPKSEAEDTGRYLLKTLKTSQIKVTNVTDELYKRLSKTLPEGNYTVFILHYAYDVPLKTSDKRKVDDAWEEVYDFVICAVCPVKTSKSTLGYLSDKGIIGENPQQLQTDNPSFGFLYPSFNKRASDSDNVLCFRTEKLDISGSLFGKAAPELVKEEKKDKKTSSGSGENVDIFYPNKPAPIQTDNPDTKKNDIPSLDSGVLSNDNHTVKERLITDEDDGYNKDESGVTDDEVRGSLSPFRPSLSASERPKSGKAISIRGDRSKVVKKAINGVMYYLVPADEAELV